MPYAPVHNVDEVIDDEQVRHLGTFYQQQHPTEGEIWGINSPMFIDGERISPMRPPPVLAASHKQILGELGLDRDEIAKLKAAKVV